MLPFLKLKQEGSSSMPVEPVKREPDEGAEYDMLDSAAEDLISSVHSKDVKGVCSALRSAFDMLESGSPNEDENE